MDRPAKPPRKTTLVSYDAWEFERRPALQSTPSRGYSRALPCR